MYIENRVELSVESFFNQAISGREDIERLMLALFEERACLEVCLSNDGVDVGLSNFNSTLVFNGDVRQEFKFVDGIELRGIFVPFLLNVHRVTIPHSSFVTMFSRGTFGSFILSTIFSHLLRGLAASTVDVGESPNVMTRQYFYYLRYLFPLSFDKRPNEYDFFMSNLVSSHSYWEDPLLTYHANMVRNFGQDQGLASLEIVKKRLLLAQSRLMQVI